MYMEASIRVVRMRRESEQVGDDKIHREHGGCCKSFCGDGKCHRLPLDESSKCLRFQLKRDTCLVPVQ